MSSIYGSMSRAARLHAVRGGQEVKVSQTYVNSKSEPFADFVTASIRQAMRFNIVARATVAPADYRLLVDTAAPERPDRAPDELGLVFTVNGMEHSVRIAPLLGQPANTVHVRWSGA